MDHLGKLGFTTGRKISDASLVNTKKRLINRLILLIDLIGIAGSVPQRRSARLSASFFSLNKDISKAVYTTCT